MYDIYKDKRYLEAAKKAGDWLITMQNNNGSMKAYEGGTKESLLYNGQCLSGLSKLYAVTKEQKYYNAAEKIAQRFLDKYNKARGYIQGEYREKNPISNAWAVMSGMDFYKISKDEKYLGLIFGLSETILDNQNNVPKDIMYYGGWAGAYSSSGMGWLGEVMAETYRFCLEQGRRDCYKYKDAVVKVIRWVMQTTYTMDNSWMIKNPYRALGGIFWNRSNRYVRTDSVCHALNSYSLIYDYLSDGVLLSVPEVTWNLK